MSERPEGAGRLVLTTLLAGLVGCMAAGAAFALQCLIGFFGNLFWFGQVATTPVDAWTHHWPAAVVILLPAAGGIVVGIMARYGSPKIRGHGIPEVMESILVSESRIPPRVAI